MSNNFDFIRDIALTIGKTPQDIANWRFAGKVPRIMRFEIYEYAKKKDGVDLSSKDFDNFKK